MVSGTDFNLNGGEVDVGASATSSLNLLEVLQNANFTVQAVIVLLAMLSIYSWGVVIRSYVTIGEQKGKLNKLNKMLSTDGASLEKLQGRFGNKGRGQCMVTNMMALAVRLINGRVHNDTSAQSIGQLGADAQMFKSSLENGMRVEVDRALFSQEKRLSGLANIASLSPFIGLFGTIIGIMHSFSAIFAAQNVSLKTIAPSISEALFATAIGIFVAVPAGLFYNKLLGDARHLRNEAEALIYNLSRHC